jgi:hypothetical protein
MADRLARLDGATVVVAHSHGRFPWLRPGVVMVVITNFALDSGEHAPLASVADVLRHSCLCPEPHITGGAG